MIRSHLIVSLFTAGIFASASAQSLVENGDFAKVLKPWKVLSMKDTPATEHALADGVLTIKAADASDKPGARQLFQPVKVEAGKSYTLTFDVKGNLEGEKEIVVAIVPAPGKFASFKKVPVAADWVTQKIKITPKEMELAPGSDPALKFLMGKNKGEITFRKISLVSAAGGSATPPKPKKEGGAAPAAPKKDAAPASNEDAGGVE